MQRRPPSLASSKPKQSWAANARGEEKQAPRRGCNSTHGAHHFATTALMYRTSSATTASSTDLFPCSFKLDGTPAHNRCPNGEARGYPGEYKPAHAPVNESPCFHLEARQVTIKAVFSYFLRYLRM